MGKTRLLAPDRGGAQRKGEVRNERITKNFPPLAMPITPAPALLETAYAFFLIANVGICC